MLFFLFFRDSREPRGQCRGLHAACKPQFTTSAVQAPSLQVRVDQRVIQIKICLYISQNYRIGTSPPDVAKYHTQGPFLWGVVLSFFWQHSQCILGLTVGAPRNVLYTNRHYGPQISTPSAIKTMKKRFNTFLKQV